MSKQNTSMNVGIYIHKVKIINYLFMGQISNAREKTL